MRVMQLSWSDGWLIKKEEEKRKKKAQTLCFADTKDGRQPLT